jgi:hypothetical protein
LLFSQDESITDHWTLTEPYACAMTSNDEENQWWSADFKEGSYKVKSINLLVRNVCCSE